MKKRQLAGLMALLMAGSTVLSACGGKTDSTAGSNAETTAAGDTTTAAGDSGATADGERAMEGNMYVTGLPIVKEQESFSMFVDDNGKPENKIMYPILEEQTNVKVDLMLFPYDIATEKKNILINSGDYPDAIGGWIMSSNDILKDGMNDGLYIPIDELIEKYSPKMQEILAIKGVRQTMTLPDGHIYTIPYATTAPQVDFSPFINQKWLEAVGMEMPTTTDEFTEVLRAFKTKDPNGNGKADEIPLTADKDNLKWGYYAGYFGQVCPKGYFAMADGKLIFAANTEAYKQSMKWLSSLYKEGLIDPEIFTHDKTQWKAKGNQNLYGVSMAYGAKDYAGEGLLPDEVTDFVPLNVLKGPGVEKPQWSRDCYGVSVLKNQLAITDKAKNPATIIRWYDNVFEIDNSIQIKAGIFGKRLEKLGENDYRYMDENLLSEEDREKYGWGNMYTQSLPNFVPEAIKIKAVEGKPEPYDEKKTVDVLYEPFLDEPVPQVWTSAEDSKKQSIIFTDIDNYIRDKNAAWISGQSDVDADWDAYLAQLEKLGLQDLINIKQTAIDALVD